VLSTKHFMCTPPKAHTYTPACISFLHGGAQWGISTVSSQCQGPGFDSGLGSLSVWSLHIFPVSVRGFPPGAPVSSHSLKDV